MRKGILILIIVLILGGGGWYFYSKSKSSTATDEPASGFKSFFPFGNSVQSNIPNSTLPQGGEQTATGDIKINQTKSPFKQLTSHTVSGYSTFITSTTITTPASTPKGKPTTETVIDHVLRYVSRNSGYVYEIKNSGTPIQISNIYVANVYEAYFADKRKTAILRFLRDDAKTIATYVVPIPDKNPDGTRTQKNGSYLPDGISSIAPSPDGSVLARITLDGGSAVLSSTTTSNTNRRELIRSPFHEWLVSWGGQKNIYLQTKASGTEGGFLYQVDDVNHRLTRILGNINGLTTSVSPNGTYVLYSQSTSKGFVTKLLTIKTGITRNVGVSILPEKCTWLKNEDLICAGGGSIGENTYPDSWYQGVSKFSDQIIRIYTAANVFDVLRTPTDGESFDMTNLQIDEGLGLLYFIDKQSGVLWQYSL
jgi:hypothetical protein